MSDPFEDFYDEIDNFGSEYSKFIHPREFGERWEGTWSYFAFTYEKAFERLAWPAQLMRMAQGGCNSSNPCSSWRVIRLN